MTGAAGFIGRSLCAALEAQGYKVVRAVRQARAANELAIGEIGPDTDWPSLFQKARNVESIVHLAARVHEIGDAAAEASFRRVNVAGTLNLAQQAAIAGVRRFVYISSVKVYGEGRATPYTEADPPAPRDAYARSKWEAEEGLKAIARTTEMEVVIVRPPLVYGPGVKGNFARMVHWVRRGWPLPFGAVDNRRSLIALENLIDFIVLCIDQARSPNAANEVFLIADAKAVSTPELLHKIAGAYGVHARLIRVSPSWLRFGAKLLGRTDLAVRLLDSFCIDSTKAHIRLGWRPVITLEQQLMRMASLDALNLECPKFAVNRRRAG